MEGSFLLSLGFLHASFWMKSPPPHSINCLPFEWFCFTWIYITGSLDALYLLESLLGVWLPLEPSLQERSIHGGLECCARSMPVFDFLCHPLTPAPAEHNLWLAPGEHLWLLRRLQLECWGAAPQFFRSHLNHWTLFFSTSSMPSPKQEVVFVCLLSDIEPHKCASRRRVSPHANVGKASRDLGECH